MTKADTEHLTKQFEKIGARLRIGRTTRGRRFQLNVQPERGRETFTLQLGPDAPDFRVLQANAAARHLLLYAADSDAGGAERFLCGHDERHWFVAAVPDRVSTITGARRALLPKALKDSGLTPDELARRRGDKFKRQGEWFFVPVTDTALLARLATLPILHSEPIRRGTQNKPHLCAELVREGGTTVFIIDGAEHTESEYRSLMKERKVRAGTAQRVTKDMVVYVRGAVRHADHATLVLDGWHSVNVNGEVVSVNMTFYD